MRFPCEISYFFGPYEISLVDFMLLAAEHEMRVREKELKEYAEKKR
jgi:hypothetical protein